ncbi:diguanylate cyclase (GGDEF)-like protein [Hoeflea marina]|uniref:Diguanylate cyclase (GGDEF)-like protein n=1 Tax=Hoeflea marina TaxID=274592 RepID=A0A317PQM6_9HYPH|nr:EAL domain-containing protein [Hoeflea marina]PWW02258.1 diguanylate cyclase (GGDEF)-like protein [Hoeflea marina]
MRLPLPTFKLFALGAVVALGAVGVIHSRMVGETESAVARSARYDVAWTGVAGRLEVLQLQKAVASYLATGRQADADQVALFSQIVDGRMTTWDSGIFQRFLDGSDKRRLKFDEMRARLRAVETDLSDLDDPAVRSRIVAELDVIAPVVDRIGADAYTVSVTQAAAVRDELRQKQRLQNRLILGLIGAGALLLVIMGGQNRRVTRAHRAATQSAADFAHLAHHDTLTGLPNRLAFKNAFDDALAHEADGAETLAVLAIDLDGFKAINDLLGHATGDALLKAVADRLSRLVERAGPGNVVSRFGGDEFVVLLRGGSTATGHENMALEILAELGRPYAIHGSTVVVGATIGLSLLNRIDDPLSNPMLDADLALSNAKARGKGVVLEFEPRMRCDYERRGRLESDMKSALANEEIMPFYQMQVDVESGELVGFEALARWRHPEFGWISPDEFIPIAESSSQIIDLGRAILWTACRHARDFPAHVGVSVNLSVGQMLRGDIAATVADVLAATGFPASRLTLEVTESVMISEPDRAMRMLGRLKRLGVSIALDDFGTGYSALGYLRQFDWDELKIDKSFVDNLGRDPRSLSIVRSVADLAGQLGIKVVAEGVETVTQHEILRGTGCNVIQGYLFGRPEPIDQVHVAMLRSLASAGGDTAAPLSRSA